MIQKFMLAACLLLLLAACNKNDDTGNTSAPIEITKEKYALPGDTLFPEGIAYQPKTGHFYTGSVSNGDILKVDVGSGAASTWASGAAQGRKAATGMKLDKQDRLWVCGGADARISVLNVNGGLLKAWDMAALFGAGFINDCIMDETHMYFTDSRVQKLYRAPITTDTPAAMEEWLSFSDAQIPYSATGTNANGIVQTPDGQYLIIVVSASGKLYRIAKSDKSITEIQLDMPVTSGDGLLLEGNMLYVSRNATNLIFPVTLAADYTKGTTGAGFGSDLRFNTTIARAGNYLLVVNGQLNLRATKNPVLPFTVSRVAFP